VEETIIMTITNLFGGADEHHWTKVESTMTDTVLLDYTSFVGGEPANLSPQQITGSWAGFLPGFDKTDHQLSDFKVITNKQKATAIYRGKADHFIDNEVWTVEGTYESELKMIDDVWKVSSLEFNFEQQSGNTTLPAEATNRMAK
jgi:hypothetical protein